jgi:hypothetical protein
MPLSRGAALALTGLWLGLLVASWIAATASFRAVDRVLGPEARPELQARLVPLPEDDRRVVRRHLASEINRWMFARWSVVQLVVAAALVVAAWPAAGAPRALALAAGAIAIVQAGLGHSIETLGRSLDFVPRPLPPDLARRFGLLHGAFVLLDLVKGVCLAVCAPLLMRLPLK